MAWWLAAVAGVALASCTILSGGDVEQCTETSDCRSRGGDFGATECVEGVCVAPQDNATTSTEATVSATTGAGGSSPEGCESNAQCAAENGQLPYICPQPGAECKSLLSEHCREVHGDFTNDDAIIIGGLVPFTGPYASYGTQMSNAIKLAAGEFDKLVGIPGGSDGARRPLVIVVCDEVADVEAATSYLVDDLDVPVIVGPRFDEAAVNAALNVVIPNDVAMVTLAVSAQFETISDNGLVWQVNPMSSYEALPLAELATLFEGKIREKHEIADEVPLRLAVVAEDDVYGSSVAETIAEVLVLNGEDAAVNFAEGNLEQISYPADNPDFSLVSSQIIEFSPHIIILAGDPELFTAMVPVVEQNWDDAELRPVYLTVDKITGHQAAMDWAGEDEDRNQRLYGIVRGFPVDKANVNAFWLRFSAQFDAADSISQPASDIYDATYVAAYALAGAGNVPALDGRAVAEGITKLLPPAPPINIGPSKINEAFQLLTVGNIDLVGTGSQLDFDRQTGVNVRNFDVFCTVGGIQFANPTIYFDATTESLVGTLECPW